VLTFHRFGLVAAALVAPSQAQAQAALTGLVVDSMAQPILGAEVSLPDLSKTVLTSERGLFRIVDIPAGSYRVLVRHIGYGPADAIIAFADGKTVDRQFALKRAAQLDSVIVNATHRDILLEEFEENRKLGLGHFWTRADIAKFEGLRLSDVLEGTPGLRVGFSGSRQAWILNPGILGANPFYGGADIPVKGAPVACYPQVYMDHTLMNPPLRMDSPPAPRPGMRATPPFDVNSIPPNQIESIEYYASSAQTPFRYTGPFSDCGTLVIHTRRVK
jgi:Carboxypeptidase regulatory-like domain